MAARKTVVKQLKHADLQVYVKIRKGKVLAYVNAPGEPAYMEEVTDKDAKKVFKRLRKNAFTAWSMTEDPEPEGEE
jgi:hypothetical protein